MRHTITEAAKLVGKDRKTLYRHIKQGRLSCGIESDGVRYVDTSELMRVYGALVQAETPVRQGETPEMPQGETPRETVSLLAELVAEVKLLRADNHRQAEQLEAIRKQLAEVPRLEDKREIPAEGKTSTSNQARHDFSAHMDKLRADLH